MPLHLGLPHGHHSHQEAAREARRMLQQKVRNDWDFPNAPHPNTHQSQSQSQSPSLDAKATVTEHVLAPGTSATQQPPALDFEPVEWRQREYSENESSASEGDGAAIAARYGAAGSPSSRPKRKQSTTPASPETVAERKLMRKRRRQERFEEEMTWNIGLAHFSAQRNAWTAARTGSTAASGIQVHAHTAEESALEQDTMDAEKDNHHHDTDTVKPTNGHLDVLAVAEDATVSLPVAPKLLPDHPVRATIHAGTYSEIYSKVILQGRTPTVPINLQDITNALIFGWKEEGNWPPKQAAPEPSVVLKKKNNANNKDVDGTVGSPSKHPHLSKGVSAVTKVFHGLTGGPMDSPRHHG